MITTPREYQINIYTSILRHGNTLVVLPTGLGKTLIALMLIEKKYPTGKCLFLSPTKPLTEQHHTSIIREFGDLKGNVTIVTGATPQTRRKTEYEKKIIVATPQTIRNDITTGLIDPSLFSLVIFDEAHRAIGEYSYTQISKKLQKETLIVGLTASPGGKKEHIQKVLDNLNISNIELRISSDGDVAPYTHKTSIFWEFVTLPPKYLLLKSELDCLIQKYSRTLSLFGFRPMLKSKTLFLQMRDRILKSKTNKKYLILMYYSVLLNLLHMAELLETQSIATLQKYIKKISERENKSSKIILNNQTIARILKEDATPHPKLILLTEIIGKLSDSKKRAIIFAQYRDQVKQIADHLVLNGFLAREFMGKKDSYTRKTQEETIREFVEGKFDFLCSSSIGEEGLDIPSVDAVIFYEPIPSEIRSIQRRGRTGRFSKGQVYILITKNTRDEYFYWASVNREKKMKSILGTIDKKSAAGDEKTSGLRPGKKLGQTKLDFF
ncbi:MAG: DEAD/DEAH box helicase family protein [Candidatus Micrarchaeia archaeon]